MGQRTQRQSSRIRTILIAGLLCCVLITSAGVATATGNLYVTVSEVTVSEDEPTTGETITITPTIRHSDASDGGFQITEVVLTGQEGTEFARIENLGTLGAGESIEAPLRAAFDTAGQKQLSVSVRGVKLNSSGTVEQIDAIDYPVYISVSEPAESEPAPEPQLQIESGTAVSGTAVPVEVTVSNSRESALTETSLHLEALDSGVDSATRLTPTISAENVTTFEFTIQPSHAGDLPLKATLQYDGGSAETIQPITVQPLHDEVTVDATLIEQNSSRALQYRLTNLGNAPIHGVTVTGDAETTTLPATALGTIDAATSKTVVLPTDVQPNQDATVSITYTAGEQTMHVNRTVSLENAATSENVTDATNRSGGQTITSAMTGLTATPLSSGGLLFVGALLGSGAVTYRQRQKRR